MNTAISRVATMAKDIVVRLPASRYIIARVEKFRSRKATLLASALSMPQWCVEEAQKYRVIPHIHPKDFIFQYILRRHVDNPREAVSEYFNSGNTSAQKLRTLFSEDIGLNYKVVRALEFASGYGCVSRHLVKYEEEILLTVCDIHDDAGAFYAEHLNVPFVRSVSVPEDFRSPGDFDVVFALSFFSHMPETSWSRWLTALFQHVAPGGFLIFTTHGMVSHANFGKPKLSKNGFRFTPRSEQLDLAPDEYGGTISTPLFVSTELAKLTDAELLLLREGDWWGHQDIYVVRKVAGGASS